jgi:predicted amidohydrolase
MLHSLIRIRIIFIPLLLTFSSIIYAQSPLHIELVRPNFITISNDLHSANRIGYRFHEHEPILYGRIPLSEREANIIPENVNALIDSFKTSPGVFTYMNKIEKSAHWVKQDWTYRMVPTDDGIEILLEIQTYEEGLPEYYGVQQCFRMSGITNETWRQEIAQTPAFSEYDLWKKEGNGQKTSLTHVMRNNQWEALPAEDKCVGARTPLGMALDHLRTDGNLMDEVGPYKARMLNPIDHALITRTDINNSWLSGIYWEQTSHVTDHHPADCIHSIINIGNIPPRSRKVLRGKIYWFEGSKDDLQHHFRKDFLNDNFQSRLNVASCQFPVSGDIDENAAWIEQQMRSAKVRNGELVHFPECALSGYGGADVNSFDEFDWDLLKERTTGICKLAKELHLWVLLGSSHQLSDGHKPHNSLYVINPEGQVQDRYDKRFCTGSDLKHYSPGDHFVHFDIGKIQCGLLICYDVRFPELYRAYSQIGVDVIFQSFYNARHDIDCIHPKIMPLSAQARAATNNFFMSLTNSSEPYSWPCHFITPNGLIDYKLEANKPGILMSEIDIRKKYYDPSRAYRKETIEGKLNSGTVVDDPKSKDRSSY